MYFSTNLVDSKTIYSLYLNQNNTQNEKDFTHVCKHVKLFVCG